LIHKLLLSSLKMHEIRTGMQDRLGPDLDWCTGLDGVSITKCGLKANVSGNEGVLLVCGGSWLGIKLMNLALRKPFRSSCSLARQCWAAVTGKPVWRCLRMCVK